jgi:hypothetical protein
MHDMLRNRTLTTDQSTGKVIAEYPERREQIFHIHNDMNLWYALRLLCVLCAVRSDLDPPHTTLTHQLSRDLAENKFQAGIALNDCPTGGFQCIPGSAVLHNTLCVRSLTS